MQFDARAEATNIDCTLVGISVKYRDARSILCALEGQRHERYQEYSLVLETLKRYEDAICDILLQLFLCYWRQCDYEDVTSVLVKEREEVKVEVCDEAVSYDPPTSVLRNPIRFACRLRVVSLYVDTSDLARYAKPEPFVYDFLSYLRMYDGILPVHILSVIYSHRNKFSLLNYFLRHRT